MEKKRIIGVLTVFIFLVAAGGCAELTLSSKKEDAGEGGKEVVPLSPTYSEFEDVRIPREMELDRDESVVYESHNLRMGVLYYSGKGNLPDVVEFFKENMTNDGWGLINSFQHKSHLLNFVKGNRSCIIFAEQKVGKTNVQIWLGPLQKGRR
jgi:hypothetical protein